MHEGSISKFHELMEECADEFLEWDGNSPTRKIIRRKLHLFRHRDNADLEQRMKEILSHIHKMENIDRRINEYFMDQHYRQFQLNKMIEDFLGYSIYLDQQKKERTETMIL